MTKEALSRTPYKMRQLLSSLTLVVSLLQLVPTIDASTSRRVTSMDGGDGGDGGTNIEEILDQLGWEGQIGQMAQIDVNVLLAEDKSGLRQDLLDHYIGELGIGSVLNNIVGTDADDDNNGSAIWTVADFRRAAVQIQQTAMRFGRPPVIWGLDSVHGANYLYDTIIAPQPISMAATFNNTVPYLAGKWASHDTRLAGITWLFSPLLGLSWNPYWSRVYETFGEDPVVVGNMALAMIEGMQEVEVNTGGKKAGKTVIPSRAAACGKHWVGYSYPHNGHDRAPSWIPTRHLYQYFLLPWKKALSKHRAASSTSKDTSLELLTIMESYTEVDGVPNVANRRTLSRLLRQELGFEGMLVTDYHEIFNQLEWHHVASNHTDALLRTLVEGSVDMSMIANEPDDYWNGMMELQRFGPALERRVRTSARRVLELKDKLNMFEESFQMKPLPNTTTTDKKDHTSAISADKVKAALEITQQSIILAKNDGGVLPLTGGTTPLKVLVTGPTANSLSFQTGGWTWQWQGVNSNKEGEWFTYGSTVKDALQSESGWKVSYECGVDILGNDCDTGSSELASSNTNSDQTDGSSQGFVDTVKGWVGWKDQNLVGIESAMKQARDMDVIVVCLGEENYAEKPGDIRDLNLPTGQYELVAGLREAAPDKTIILVYFGGRPRLLSEVVPQVDAVLLAFLPGPLAGNAVVNILTGRANPSGRLPITYPMYQDLGGVPYLHTVSDMCTRDTGGTLPHWENIPCQVQWPFGHGLSYTRFEYSDIQTNVDTLQQHWDNEHTTDLEVYVTVTNKGDQAGSETVLFFSFDEFRSTTPEYKRLRGYEKVWLEPGGSTQVMLAISLDDLRFVGPHDDSHYILQDGMVFRLGVGADTDCRIDPDSDLCSRPITIQTESDYVGACEVACGLWQTSGCHDLTDDMTCRRTCSSIHQNDLSTGVELNNDGWGWGYVSCLESIVWNGAFDSSTDCWKMTSFCRNVLKTPGMDEYGSGEAPNMGNTTVTIVLSLVSGLFASAMIAYAMQGGFKSKEDDMIRGVQFAAVNTSEVC